MVGCDDAARDGAAAGDQSTEARPMIALVMKTLTNPFFLKMETGARAAAATLGVDVVVRTAAQETSVEQQIVIVEDLVHEKVDAIVISPGDSVRLIPPLKEAQDAGIVVINIDNRLDPTYAEKLGLTDVPFISVDNEHGAYVSARRLAATATGPAEAVILEGIRSAANAEARRRGAVRAFTEAPHVTLIASETANWKIDEAFAVMGRLLERHPELDLVFAANDMMALGALERLAREGRTRVRVAGYDALDEAEEALRDGRLVATVDQRAARQGYLGIAHAVDRLAGKPVPETVMLDVLLVTRESLVP